MKQNPRALVCYGGEASFAWMRLLKPQFRHCFVVLNTGKHWVAVNGLFHHLDISVFDFPADCDVAPALTRQGFLVQQVQPKPPVQRALMPLPFTCVETVKRTIGIQSLRTLTPYQLYRFIEAERRAENKNQKTPKNYLTGMSI